MPSLLCPIVGSYYHPPAESILGALPIGTKLSLDPDPFGETTGTPHDDPTAVAVYAHPTPDAYKKLSLILPTLEIPNNPFLGYCARNPRDPNYCTAATLFHLCNNPDLDWTAQLTFSPTGRPALVQVDFIQPQQ